jgi:hypothetical protein
VVIRTFARLKPTEACNRPHMHNRCIQSGPAFREHRHRVGGASHLISLGASKSLSAISSLSTWRAGRGIEGIEMVGLQHSHSQTLLLLHSETPYCFPAFSWGTVVSSAAEQRHLILTINDSS